MNPIGIKYSVNSYQYNPDQSAAAVTAERAAPVVAADLAKLNNCLSIGATPPPVYASGVACIEPVATGRRT